MSRTLTTRHAHTRALLLLVALAALALALLGTYFAAPAEAATFQPGFGKGSARECTRTISSGSIEAAANSLGPGGVLCLRGGTYSESDRRITINTSGTATSPKKIKAYPGERVEIRASFRSSSGGVRHWVIEGVFVDGSYSPVGSVGPRTNTDQAIGFFSSTNITLDSVELINRRPNLNPDLAGTCLYLGGNSSSTNVTIQNSSIHQCGQLPRSNHEHCIYASGVNNLTLRNNWFYDCADRSIQLYPDANSSLVVGNLVDSNHQNGISLGSDADNNVVANNVVNTPNGNTIYTGNTYSGSGNIVKDNCVWDTREDLASNVTASGNILANPLISGYSVTNVTCAAKLPVGSWFQ